MRDRTVKRLQYTGLGALAVVALAMGGFALAKTAPSPEPAAGWHAPSTSATATPTATAAPPIVVQRRGGEPLRVLFSGDSLTGGLYASTQSNAYKWLMLDEIKKSGPVDEMSSALTGGTTLEVSSKFDVPANLDLAVVELGTNDKAKATSIPDFQKAYAALLTKIRAGSPAAGLVCAGVWEDVNGGPDAIPYNNVISAECTSRGGRFVNLTPIYKNPATIGPVGVPSYGGVSDNFHPNDTGHRAIADALLAQIRVG